jgi:general secretion pathway protein N
MTRPHTFHRAWAWAAAGGLLGAVVAAGVLAPAIWLAQAVNAASLGRVQLRQASGSLWNGSAQWVLTAGARASDIQALPGAVHWRLRPQWGTQGPGLSLQVSADCCTSSPLSLQWLPGQGGGDITLADGQSRWPAELLTGLGAPWNTLQAQGWIRVNSQQAQLHSSPQGWRMGGQLRLQALDVSVRLSTLRPLGSYQLDVQGGARTTLSLTTLNGRLQLSGQGHWQGQGQGLVFSGEASAEPEHEAALNNLLNLMGQRQGSRSSFKIG